MKIGMVLERDFPTTPPDIRVEKEIQSLFRANHKIDLLSLKETSEASHENRDGLHILREPIKMLKVKDWNKENVRTTFHSEDSPWTEAVLKFIAARHIEALHVHDLPLVWSVCYAAKKRGIPVVFDMHETYPPMVRFMRPEIENGWDHHQWVERYERECLELVDKIIVVVEESRERLIQMGIPKEKIVVVMNTEAVEKMGVDSKNNHHINIPKDKLIVTYVGAFGEIRGLEFLIRALKVLISKYPIHLLLVGGEYNQRDLEALSRELSIEENVTITGWVGFKSVPGIIKKSDICVVPHVKNDFTDTTVPHKLFQYMLMGKPVVASDAKPLKRIVKECECGVVFKSGEIEDLAFQLSGLLESEDQRLRLGQNGVRCARECYNWSHAEDNLLNLYRNIF